MTIEEMFHEYFKNCVATRFLWVYAADSTEIALFDMNKKECMDLLSADSFHACKPDTRTYKRKKFDGMEDQSDCFRIGLQTFRQSLVKLYGTDKPKAFYVESITVDRLKEYGEIVCQEKDAYVKGFCGHGSKKYTSGDIAECFAFEYIAGTRVTWYKNCRRYDKGTDCDIWEIKSLLSDRGAPTFTP